MTPVKSEYRIERQRVVHMPTGTVVSMSHQSVRGDWTVYMRPGREMGDYDEHEVARVGWELWSARQ